MNKEIGIIDDVTHKVIVLDKYQTDNIVHINDIDMNDKTDEGVLKAMCYFINKGNRMKVKVPALTSLKNVKVGDKLLIDESAMMSLKVDWQLFEVVYKRLDVVFVKNLQTGNETYIIDNSVAVRIGRIEPLCYETDDNPKYHQYVSSSGQVRITYTLTNETIIA